MIPVHKMSSESHCWKKKRDTVKKLKHDERTPRWSLRIRILFLSLTKTTILDWHINGKENENDTTFA